MGRGATADAAIAEDQEAIAAAGQGISWVDSTAKAERASEQTTPPAAASKQEGAASSAFSAACDRPTNHCVQPTMEAPPGPEPMELDAPSFPNPSSGAAAWKGGEDQHLCGS
jgi:hypothetical protein